ncbi:MAG TPA: exodeoxyribonuclease V subunit gamma [Polyangia bacterium]|nr:exodeoxyribonuclease V subunit gamma [Polyangia bacterium]
MIHLCYANQTEALLEALNERLAEARAQPSASLFEPTHLVIPNRHVETYVKLGVARALGVAANIQTRFLRGFLADVARQNVSGGGAVEIIDRRQIQGELLALLHDDRFLASRDLGPVRDYLTAAGTAADAVDLRRYQMSAQLASLFDDYAFSRPEMLHAWREGRLAEGPDLVMQRWQRELWLGIFGRGGTLPTRSRRDGRPRLTLAALFDQPSAEPLRLPPAVHIFGISYVARLYRRIFSALAQSTELHIYALNPCREFWEDLEIAARKPRGGASRRKFPPRRSPEQLTLGVGATMEQRAAPDDDGDENPLLTLWGRPGRDNIKLLNQLSDCNFEARFRDPLAATGAATPTVLRQVQKDVLDRVPARTAADRLALRDDSVTIFACPDPRRELETIAAEIWRLVRAGDQTTDAATPGAPRPLAFNDIAVLVPGPNAAARLALTSAVFEEASQLPHSVADLPMDADSRVAEAIELLLALPLGPLGRQDLLRLAMHPVVAGRFPGVDARGWLQLCDDLGIVHGADHQDHAGTYIDRDVFNWDQGLRRLALGAFISGPRSGEQRLFDAGADRYLPEELPAQAQESATRFSLLVRSLLADARHARTARLSLPDWMAFLRAAIARTITARDPADQAALMRCLAELQPLEEMAAPDLLVGYRVACELARSALDGLTARRGQSLADGVTVSSFLPMRAVPFRAIFIAGLGEGEFPAAERTAPLDLRVQAPKPGDVSAREQDQYMFLEALLCARERLYCSYVACDPLTGEPRAPSSVLIDLLATLDSGYWAPGTRDTVTRRPPLRRHEDDDVRAVFPAAERERTAAALGDDLKAALVPPDGQASSLSGGPRPELAQVRRHLDAEAWRRVGAALGWMAPPAPLAAGETAAVASKLTLSTAQLRRFLECPLQGSTAVLLRLQEADDGVEAAFREDEDFDPPARAVVGFLRELFAGALQDQATAGVGAAALNEALGRAYDASAERKVLDGTLPLGAFGAVMRRRHLQILNGWLEGVRRLVGDDVPPAARLFFGHADEHAAVPRASIREAITLDVPVGGAAEATAATSTPTRTVRVSIHGRCELAAEHNGERLTLLLPTSVDKKDDGRDQREFLRAFIDHVMVAAAGDGPARPTRALICRPVLTTRDRLPEVVFAPLAPAAAREYLQAVLTDLLSGVHDYLLPWEAVLSWRKKDPRPPVPDIVSMLRDDNWTRFQSDFGPVPEARGYPPPADPVARAIIQRRYGLFFDGRVAPPRAAATASNEDD